MRIKHSRLVASALVAIAAGCQPSPRQQSTRFQTGVAVRRTGQPDVDVVSSEDAAMNAAIAKARASVATFIKALKAPKKGQKSFAIKKRFQEGGDGEHMWINRLSFDGSLFHGLLSNVPINIPSIQKGDPVLCPPSEISDWMFIDRGKLVGGATIRVEYNTLSSPEKKRFLKESGFRF